MTWLRLILLGIAVPLFFGIWWWSARAARKRSPEAPRERVDPEFMGNSWDAPAPVTAAHELASDGGSAPHSQPGAAWRFPDAVEPRLFDEPATDRVEQLEPPAYARSEGGAKRVSPSEAIPIIDVSAESVAAYAKADGPIDVSVKPAVEAVTVWLATAAALASESLPAQPAQSASHAPVGAANEASQANPMSQATEALPERVVAIRVVFARSVSGLRLKMWFDQEGLKLGQHQLYYHLLHGQSQFMVANLNQPGVFDPKTLESRQYQGLTFFAVYPALAIGVRVSAQARFDDMFECARRVAEQLGGVLQTDTGAEFGVTLMMQIRDELKVYELPGVGGA